MLLWYLVMRGFESLKEWVHTHFDFISEGETYSVFDLEGVRMRVVHMPAEDWVAIAGVICDGDLIPHGDALSYNRYRARIGALAIENGRYQLRQMVPRALLDETGFRSITLAVAREVLRLARAVCPEPMPCGELFAAYCE